MNLPADEDKKMLINSFRVTSFFLIVIWSIKIIEIIYSLDLSHYGIYPRTLNGSIGIFLAPVIHGDFYHLISNSFPILFLGTGIYYFYPKIASAVILIIYLASGLAVWIMAREAYHIGASGVVYGLISFLLVSGFIKKDKSALAISFIILVLYGGSFAYGFFPVDAGISWEAHLMGAVIGVICAFYFKNHRLISTTIHTQNEAEGNTYDPYSSYTSSDENNRYQYQFKPKDRSNEVDE